MPKHIRLSLSSPEEPDLSDSPQDVLSSTVVWSVKQNTSMRNIVFGCWRPCIMSDFINVSDEGCAPKNNALFPPSVKPQIQTCASENLSSWALSVGDAEGFRCKVPRLTNGSFPLNATVQYSNYFRFDCQSGENVVV